MIGNSTFYRRDITEGRLHGEAGDRRVDLERVAGGWWLVC